MRDPNLTELLARRGATTRIAKACGISTAAVCQWKKVPAKRIDQVAAALDVSPDQVRPAPIREAA